MKMIQHLPDGTAIKLDIIESFLRAVKNPENIQDGEINWDFVDADMNMDLGFYGSSYINECMEVLADEYELDLAYDRLQVLKTDFLGLGA